MMIHQPISQPWRIGLGIAAVLLLVLLYTLLSHHRQAGKRQGAARELVQLEQQQIELQSRLRAAASIEDATARGRQEQNLQAEQQQLASRVETLERQSREAMDRTVPTWSGLYREGLLRVLTPQGLRGDEYWLRDDALATVGRLVAGMLVSVLLSIALGLLMGCFAPIEAFFVPPLAFLAKIPPTAMLAVFFVLVGTTLKMYVAMIAFGTLPTLAQTIHQSARQDVPEELIHKAYTLGAHHTEVIWNVIYKQTLPKLIDAVRLQIGPAMVLLVAAEWMVAGEGFGYRLRLFYQRTDMTVVYVYLIILGAAGLAVDFALIWCRRKICPWFDQ